MTKHLDSELDTMILFTDPEFAAISSSVVRDIAHHGGDVSRFVPDAVDL